MTILSQTGVDYKPIPYWAKLYHESMEGKSYAPEHITIVMRVIARVVQAQRRSFPLYINPEQVCEILARNTVASNGSFVPIAANTLAQYLSHWKGFVEYVGIRGNYTLEMVAYLAMLKPVIKGVRQRIVKPKPRWLTTEEFNCMCDAANPDMADLLRIMLATGGRAHEVVQFRPEVMKTAFIDVKRGKRSPVHGFYLPEEAMQHWPGACHRLARMKRNGRLGLPSPANLSELIMRLAKRAGVGTPDRHIRAHVIRHTAATMMLHTGADLTQIQAFLGHATLAATMIYLHGLDERAYPAQAKMFSHVMGGPERIAREERDAV